MNSGKILACLNIALSVGASVGYVVYADYPRAAYWLLGAGITAVVTWLF